MDHVLDKDFFYLFRNIGPSVLRLTISGQCSYRFACLNLHYKSPSQMHLFGTREKNVNMEIYNSKYEQRIQGRFWFCLYLKVCFYEISADISRC